MSIDARLTSDRFPRSSAYHPDWQIASASGGANSLWLTEWLAESLDLPRGARVLDLGCGRAASSIFLRREFGVQVWATDLWFSPSENLRRIRDAGVEDGVFPIHADARSLPFAAEFFDALVCVDSAMYFGTDDHFLNTIARFIKPGGLLGIASAGLIREFVGPIPQALQAWWTPDCWSLHSADWWRRHWERVGTVEIERADSMPEGWRYWRDWHQTICPENLEEIRAVEADQGQTLGYVRVVARRKIGVDLDPPIVSLPEQYTRAPLLR